MSSESAAGKVDWIGGLKGAGVIGFGSFLLGAGVQSLLAISGQLPTITPFLAGLSTLFGVAYGFADGANVG